MSFDQVTEALYDEWLDLQSHSPHKAFHSIDNWIDLILKYMELVKNADSETEKLKQLKKVVVQAICCFKQHGVPSGES